MLKYAGLALASVSGAAAAVAIVFELPHSIGAALAAASVAGLIPTAVLWRQTRRRRTWHQCRECGYDLQGVRSGICPECGLVFAMPAALWHWKTRDLPSTGFCPTCSLRLDDGTSGSCPGCGRPLPPLQVPPSGPQTSSPQRVRHRSKV